MSVQIYSYGGCIRLVTDSSVLLLAKTQIKSVEAVRDDSVKISLGQGPLNEIIIKLSDVTMPSNLVDIAALRDAIAHMLDHANLYEDEALLKLQNQIDQLIEIKQLINLWQGSLQIDLNFQQLQVNALVAINNRLLEAKDNDDRLIHQVEEQVMEIKSQSLQLVALLAVITAIKTANENGLLKQDAQNNTLTLINQAQASVNTVLTDIKVLFNSSLGKLDSQSNTLTLINQAQTSGNGLLTDIKGLFNGSLSKQDSEVSLLTDIKVTDGLIKGILADILTELKAHTSKLTTIDSTLTDHKTQNTTLLSKQDSIISLLTAIKNK